MKKAFALVILAVGLMTVPVKAATFSATFTSGVVTASVCPSGTTTACEVGTVVLDTTATSTLCTAAGTATSCSTTVPTSWAYGVTHTITAQTQYYGSTAGTLLTTTGVATGSGGNQIAVENLVPNPPTGLQVTIAVLVMTKDHAKGWLIPLPDTDDPGVSAQVGE